MTGGSIEPHLPTIPLQLARSWPRYSMSGNQIYPDDDSLLEGLLNGERAAVERVRWWVRYSLRKHRLRGFDHLEDLEQEVLLDLTVALRAGRFERRSSLSSYVRMFAHHKCIDRLRAHRRREWVSIEDLGLESPDPLPDEQLSRAETVDLGLRVLAEMPAQCKELWQLIEQGHRYRDISRRLGVSEGSLRVRVLRCRRQALAVRERLLKLLQ